MSISRKLTSVAGTALASTAAAGVLATVVNTPAMTLTVHADETHDQNVSTTPSPGDNEVSDPTKVSTISDAYSDIQGDTARDTNASQHSSKAFEYMSTDEAVASWGSPDDTTKEPGTDNTQTDWNIATGTNGKSASDVSYDVTGDSSENKFNPGNIIDTSLATDKSSSVRENWQAIEKANMAYDDFVANYGSYWGPIYWGWYNAGYPAYYGTYPVATGTGAVVVSNNNNNNSSNNNNGLNSLNGLSASLLANNGSTGGSTSTGSNGGNGNSVNGQQGQQGQQSSQNGQNSSSSSSSANSQNQTTVLPNGTVVNGIGGVGYGIGGLGVVSNNNNNNNNNSNNLNSLSNLGSLSNLSTNSNNGISGSNKQTDFIPDNTTKSEEKSSKNEQGTTPVATKDTEEATTPATTVDNGETAATSSTGTGSDSASNGNVATDTDVVASTPTSAVTSSNSGSTGDSGTVVSSNSSSAALPQTGNARLEKASMAGASVIVATLAAMGVKKRKD